MQLIVNGFSDNEHMFTFMAANVSCARNFRKDWENCLKEAKEENEDWQVLDIEKGLKKFGWVLESVNTVEVAY